VNLWAVGCADVCLTARARSLWKSRRLMALLWQDHIKFHYGKVFSITLHKATDSHACAAEINDARSRGVLAFTA
jgi:hypothetical protein